MAYFLWGGGGNHYAYMTRNKDSLFGDGVTSKATVNEISVFAPGNSPEGSGRAVNYIIISKKHTYKNVNGCYYKFFFLLCG